MQINRSRVIEYICKCTRGTPKISPLGLLPGCIFLNVHEMNGFLKPKYCIVFLCPDCDSYIAFTTSLDNIKKENKIIQTTLEGSMLYDTYLRYFQFYTNLLTGEAIEILE